MTLKELYLQKKKQTAPARAFVREVAAVAKKTEPAVYRWINGDAVPDALTQQVLADHLGTTPEELFPVTDKA